MPGIGHEASPAGFVIVYVWRRPPDKKAVPWHKKILYSRNRFKAFLSQAGHHMNSVFMNHRQSLGFILPKCILDIRLGAPDTQIFQKPGGIPVDLKKHIHRITPQECDGSICLLPIYRHMATSFQRVKTRVQEQALVILQGICFSRNESPVSQSSGGLQSF